jgi:carboxylesterase type B
MTRCISFSRRAFLPSRLVTSGSRSESRRCFRQSGAPVYVYRFDCETLEAGGHMLLPHVVEVPFVFENIKVAGPLISKMREA